MYVLDEGREPSCVLKLSHECAREFSVHSSGY